ncbi:hypothetical protein MSAN_01537700 [Mycena sanguinolenta]|uniref:Uncharacterized protein n=1 Tax=Mycena sanguinolenta TaxID=230812 RepID=A0A8H6Y7U0_9AGAR|nr:hypothetical protein MSAN_01537700 [Mycena sanguinolenta]
MSDFTSLRTVLRSLILESCLYGIALTLFLSTIYFIVTRRTLASNRQTVKHQFTSLVFLGVTILFLATTAHWAVGIYQTFLILPDSGANPTHASGVLDVLSLSTAILAAECLMIYRLWVVWAHNPRIVIFPMCSLSGVLVAAVGISYVFIQTESNAVFLDNTKLKPWITTGFVFSILTSFYSTGFIAFRIVKFNVHQTSNSVLMFFLAILVESAALQTFWLVFTSSTILATSSVEFLTLDAFPVVLCISNLLIHVRVGLGWSRDDQAGSQDATPSFLSYSLQSNP